MKAVLIYVDVHGVDPVAGGAALRENVAPAIAAMPGFVSGTWLTGGGQDGYGLSLTVWATSEAAEQFAGQFSAGVNPAAGASVRSCELRDVATIA